MKVYIAALFLIVGLYACDNSSTQPLSDSVQHDSAKPDSVVKAEELAERLNANSIACDIPYDTITNPAYNMHKLILDKWNHPEKRGYVRSENGDTVNTFLYHQDIAVFINQLDTNENGVYKMLTNKVVFLILENEPRMLDHSLNRESENWDYFIWHVQHPTCNTISLDSTAARIDREWIWTDPDRLANKNTVLLSLGYFTSK